MTEEQAAELIAMLTRLTVAIEKLVELKTPASWCENASCLSNGDEEWQP